MQRMPKKNYTNPQNPQEHQMPKKKSREDLRKEFLIAHKAWEKVNNWEGYISGKVHKMWKKRTKALTALVRSDK